MVGRPYSISPEMLPAIIEGYTNGKSSMELERDLGFAHSTILGALKRQGVRIRSHKEARQLAVRQGKHLQTPAWIPKEIWKISYLAAGLDGEGTITIQHVFRKTRGAHDAPLVRVANNCYEMIEWLSNTFGCGKPYAAHYWYKGEKRTNWRWETCSYVNARVILKAVLPYLIVKKREAEMVLRFCEDKYNKLFQLKSVKTVVKA